LKRGFAHTKIKNVLLVILVLVVMLDGFMTDVSKEQASTQVSVKPPDQTVGQADMPLPTSPFTINITVENVVDLFGWQIVLYYNSSILKEENVTLPPDHVFEDKQYMRLGPFIESDSKGTYILFGATLLAPPGVTVTGSGVLCQIKFTGYAPGTSWLNLGNTTDGGMYTKLRNSNNELIAGPNNTIDGKVTVAGIETREPSTITIDVDPSTVAVGSNVTITGTIDPTRVGVDVTIHRRPINETWYPLTTVQTNESGRYRYHWTASEVGEFEFKASWPGDAYYTKAESNITTVTVIKRASSISLNVYPINATVGSRLTINGTITPKPDFSIDVTIYYRQVGGTWNKLYTGKTDINGVYRYTWETKEGGSYELKASWLGDDKTLPAESDVKLVEITGELPEAPSIGVMAYVPYIVGAIAIMAVVTVVIYLLKKR
jgi:5-hydroxyisourate hydrolase-like protein (transthyretin family)